MVLRQSGRLEQCPVEPDAGTTLLYFGDTEQPPGYRLKETDKLKLPTQEGCGGLLAEGSEDTVADQECLCAVCSNHLHLCDDVQSCLLGCTAAVYPRRQL
jgi:hypothetical protein